MRAVQTSLGWEIADDTGTLEFDGMVYRTRAMCVAAIRDEVRAHDDRQASQRLYCAGVERACGYCEE